MTPGELETVIERVRLHRAAIAAQLLRLDLALEALQSVEPVGPDYDRLRELAVSALDPARGPKR